MVRCNFFYLITIFSQIINQQPSSTTKIFPLLKYGIFNTIFLPSNVQRICGYWFYVWVSVCLCTRVPTCVIEHYNKFSHNLTVPLFKYEKINLYCLKFRTYCHDYMNYSILPYPSPNFGHCNSFPALVHVTSGNHQSAVNIISFTIFLIFSTDQRNCYRTATYCNWSRDNNKCIDKLINCEKGKRSIE